MRMADRQSLIFQFNPGRKTMPKTFALALLAISLSAGSAQAAASFSLGMARHKHAIPGCIMGQQAVATCACGTAADGKRVALSEGAMVPLPVHECLYAVGG
jgi:hypothetical protein